MFTKKIVILIVINIMFPINIGFAEERTDWSFIIRKGGKPEFACTCFCNSHERFNRGECFLISCSCVKKHKEKNCYLAVTFAWEKEMTEPFSILNLKEKAEVKVYKNPKNKICRY